MQVILDSFSARVEPLYGAGRKESSGTGLSEILLFFSYKGYFDTLVFHKAVNKIRAENRHHLLPRDVCYL